MDQSYEFIENAVSRGNGVLVYSVKGKGRSCALATAYLMRKYRWTLFKALEFMNLRMPELDIRPECISQLEAYKERLTVCGLGPRTSSWMQVFEKAPSDFENEELMLRNTYLNSQVGPFVDFQAADLCEKGFRLKWADQMLGERPLASVIDEKSAMASSKTQDTLPNELTGEVVEAKAAPSAGRKAATGESKALKLSIRIKSKTKVNAVRVKHPLTMQSHLRCRDNTIKLVLNSEGSPKSRNAGREQEAGGEEKGTAEFPPAKAQLVPSLNPTALVRFHRTANSITQKTAQRKKPLSRSTSDVLSDAVQRCALADNARESRNRRTGKELAGLRRKAAASETRKGPVAGKWFKVSPLKGEVSPKPAQITRYGNKVLKGAKLNVRIAHSMSTAKINAGEVTGRNINPKKMLKTCNTSPVVDISSLRHFNN